MSKKESITEGHEPDYNTEVYYGMIDIMIKNYELRKDYNSDIMFKELADYYKNHPDSVELDILHLSWNEAMQMGDFVQFTTYINESSQPGMTHQDCIKLAQRYHFMLLTKLSKEWEEPSYSQKEETFRLYEKMCDDIYKGYATPQEIAFLKTLPDIENWDHDLAYSMTYGSPFFPDKPKFIDFDDINQMEERYIELHPKEKRMNAEEILRLTKKLNELQDPHNSEENFRIWLGEELRCMQIDKVTENDE